MFGITNPEMYKKHYNINEFHSGCYDNFQKVIKKFNIKENYIPTPLNIFMNTSISSTGNIKVTDIIALL